MYAKRALRRAQQETVWARRVKNFRAVTSSPPPTFFFLKHQAKACSCMICKKERYAREPKHSRIPVE